MAEIKKINCRRCTTIIAKGETYSVAFTVASYVRVYEFEKLIEEYCCCEPCRSEKVFDHNSLLFNVAHPYYFIPVFGIYSGVIFRHGNIRKGNPRTIAYDNNMMGGHERLHKDFVYLKPVDIDYFIIDGILSNKKIIGMTSYYLKNHIRVELEYPCKTINLNKESGDRQVDTGIIALLLEYRKGKPIVEMLRLAYVAFFLKDRVNFMVDEYKDGNIDFTKNMTMDCKNKLYVLE